MKNQHLTGYPSMDKPWLKYYSEEARNCPMPECTIYEYIWENNKHHLNDVALMYFGRKITYKELFYNINKTAYAFSSLGVKKGEIVGVALPNIPENIYCVYALNKLGAVADMIDLRSKGDLLAHYLNESNARFAVICDMFAKNIFEIVDDIHIEKIIVSSPFDSLPMPFRRLMKLKVGKINMPQNAVFWKDFQKSIAFNGKEMPAKIHDVACIFHTSGTTDIPKGVMLTNRNFNSMTVEYKYSGMNFSSGDTFLNQVPPFLAYNTILAVHLPLSLHMCIKLLPDYQPNCFAKNISRHKPNHVVAGPADWKNLLECQNKLAKDLSFLKTMASGSDTMNQKDKTNVNEIAKKRGVHCEITEGYGMTEIGSAACTNLPQCNVPGSVGIPLPLNTFCAFDNDNNRELPYGKSGEICMTGPTVMKGYYKNKAETENALKKHSDGKIWLHSGDLGHIDENGCIYIDGRLKRVIVCHNGIKVFPFPIEQFLLKDNNIAACCVVGKNDTVHGQGQTPVAFIVLVNETPKYVEKIKVNCKSEFSGFYLPSEYIIIEKLPLTPNGKVDFCKLERMAAETSHFTQDGR